MDSFVYNSNPSRIIFGPDSIDRLPEELDRLGARRALVLCTPHQREKAQAVADRIGARVASIFDGAAMHVPIEVARKARALATELEVDCALAIGGGSTVGLGKAIALESGLPIIAVPTTYAGSEVTPIYGITEGGVKKTGRDLRVLPKVVVYDPKLTLSLPMDLTVTSAINAIAHAAEGLYAHDGNPVTALMAEEGIRACAASLQSLRDDPQNLAARGLALSGAWLCGTVLGAVSMGLHHKLCHTLGGTFDLPHADVHTVVLPHALQYNAEAAPQAMIRIARALGVVNAPMGLFALAESHGAPVSLKAIGMDESGLDHAVELAVSNQYPNPRPLERAPLKKLLDQAFEGAAPAP
ncbi:maleylacetate reductase [Variovorax sp. J31P207]|uniref:maleylacetate reductase n=1 Tax=Variovorax sp. J31P207 TaxID=3053510 RepID=UPI0025753A6E|nr:maleylacetate reductase [Variovorax sp. J31P207]MDM0066978.1 maleylacetate reductase [Variovorax sp. J31P207]